MKSNEAVKPEVPSLISVQSYFKNELKGEWDFEKKIWNGQPHIYKNNVSN